MVTYSRGDFMKQFEETRVNKYYCKENGTCFKENKKTGLTTEVIPFKNNRGYSVIYANGPKFVHRIVATLFVKGDSSLQVNHKDGIKENNNANNLEWLTCSENLKHAVRLKLNPQAGETHIKAKLTEKIVTELREKWDQSYNSIVVYAKKYGVSENTIKLALEGKTWANLATAGKRLNKLTEPHNKVLSEKTLKELAENFIDDVNYYEKLCFELNVTFSYLMTSIRKHNPEFPKLTKRKRKSSYDSLVTEEIFERIKKGETIASLARELSIPRKTLSVLYNRTRA
jgi:hypothetical protein